MLPPKATLDVVLGELHLDIKSRGLDAFWNLRTYLLNLDKLTNSEGKIDREDLKDALVTWGVSLSKTYFDAVIDLVDVTKTGLISWPDFLALIRGPLPAEREYLISQVWSSLAEAAGKPGALSPDDLAAFFNPKEHPLVALGGAPEKDAFAHFLRHLSVKGRAPTIVRLEGFQSYYADLSAGVDDDGHFEQIVRGSWPV